MKDACRYKKVLIYMRCIDCVRLLLTMEKLQLYKRQEFLLN